MRASALLTVTHGVTNGDALGAMARDALARAAVLARIAEREMM